VQAVLLHPLVRGKSIASPVTALEDIHGLLLCLFYSVTAAGTSSNELSIVDASSILPSLSMVDAPSILPSHFQTAFQNFFSGSGLPLIRHLDSVVFLPQPHVMVMVA